MFGIGSFRGASFISWLVFFAINQLSSRRCLDGLVGQRVVQNGMQADGFLSRLIVFMGSVPHIRALYVQIQDAALG